MNISRVGDYEYYEPQFERRQLPGSRIPPQAQEILDAYEGTAVIAGGYPRWLLLGEPEPTDIDVFPIRNAQLPNRLPARYRDITSTPRSLMYQSRGEKPVQLVHPYVVGRRRSWGQPMEIIGGFDFQVTQFALWKEAGAYYIMYPTPLSDMRVGATLMLTGPIEDDPVDTAWRAAKYAAKGYKVPKSLFIELFSAFDGMDEEQKSKVLEGWGY